MKDTNTEKYKSKEEHKEHASQESTHKNEKLRNVAIGALATIFITLGVVAGVALVANQQDVGIEDIPSDFAFHSENDVIEIAYPEDFSLEDFSDFLVISPDGEDPTATLDVRITAYNDVKGETDESEQAFEYLKERDCKQYIATVQENSDNDDSFSIDKKQRVKLHNLRGCYFEFSADNEQFTNAYVLLAEDSEDVLFMNVNRRGDESDDFDDLSTAARTLKLKDVKEE